MSHENATIMPSGISFSCMIFLNANQYFTALFLLPHTTIALAFQPTNHFKYT